MIPITGRHSQKKYKCTKCGHETMIGTNHWGQCYSWGSVNHCPNCPPMEPTIWECQEKPPNGIGIPDNWIPVKVSDTD